MSEHSSSQDDINDTGLGVRPGGVDLFDFTAAAFRPRPPHQFVEEPLMVDIPWVPKSSSPSRWQRPVAGKEAVFVAGDSVLTGFETDHSQLQISSDSWPLKGTHMLFSVPMTVL